jgi:hypothetical protein
MVNSNGPKFETCGIPHCTVFCCDLELFSIQTCLRLLKYADQIAKIAKWSRIFEKQ